MTRRKVDNPKVPMGVSVRRSTKEYIQANHIKAGDILDDIFKDKAKEN